MSRRRLAKEATLYGIFGVLTTVVNLATYHGALWAGMSYGYANGVAFVLAISFAYITNKLWVFQSQTEDLKSLLSEIGKFLMARLGTFVFEMAGLWLMIDGLGWNEWLPKYVMTVLVILLNYVLSKWLVFKKNKDIR